LKTRREHAIPLHTTKGSENTNVQRRTLLEKFISSEEDYIKGIDKV
jgi:hypothetical protein